MAKHNKLYFKDLVLVEWFDDRTVSDILNETGYSSDEIVKIDISDE